MWRRCQGTINRAFVLVGGEKNDGRMLALADPLRRLNAVAVPLDLNVHQNQIRVQFRGLVDRLIVTGHGADHFVAEGLQLCLDVHGDDRFVLDDENTASNGREFCSQYLPIFPGNRSLFISHPATRIPHLATRIPDRISV
jgi:hypothetical protein